MIEAGALQGAPAESAHILNAAIHGGIFYS
jgi:hypothetical protein